MKVQNIKNRSEKKIRPANGWEAAVGLVMKYELRRAKADALLEDVATSLNPSERRLCQALFYIWLRNLSRIDWELERWQRKKPRAVFQAILRIAVAEIIDSPTDKAPKVVDFAVRTCGKLASKAEGKAANAILRRVVESVQSGEALRSAPEEILCNHPKTLIDKWITIFDKDKVKALAEWNAGIASVYVRVYGSDELPEGLEPTEWAGFYRWTGGDWSAIDAFLSRAKAYVQDPLTRRPAELLKVGRSDLVLDLCASPGGKTASFAEGEPERIVAVDKEGPRVERMRENFERLGLQAVQIVGADIMKLKPKDLEVGTRIKQYTAVSLDAPCSNTGVLRRRPDARWRLTPESIEEQCRTQLALLKCAARFVAPEGRLVYSTCSIEPEENRGVVDQFLAASGDAFELVEEVLDFPPEAGHDGGGAFLLRRK